MSQPGCGTSFIIRSKGLLVKFILIPPYLPPTDDLLPLAEQGKEPPKEVTPEPEPKPTEPVEEVPEPEPEKKDSPLLSLLMIGAVVLIGGGVGYYFKIYKPKHEAPDLEDDYCEYEDEGPEEIAEEPEDEDTPPWDEDTEEQEARQ